jgi:hypothetical protein
MSASGSTDQATTTPTTEPVPAPATLPPLPPPSRPLGVAILSVLIGLYGILWIVLGLLVILGETIGSLEKDIGALTSYGPVTAHIEVGLIVLVVGLIILGIAVALYHLRMWALVLALLVLIFVMVSYGLHGTSGIYAHIYAFGAALILFLYLIAVNRHFR